MLVNSVGVETNTAVTDANRLVDGGRSALLQDDTLPSYRDRAESDENG
ncbi:hypothetical protein [Halorussus litoreus]|nr:hypothetical protein [Halorussus litoreus]